MDEHPTWAGLYILDEHDEPVPCYDTLTWGRWMEEARASGRRRVAQDSDEGDPHTQLWVSTVFLGCDHSFGSGPPLLYETMVFQQTGERADEIDGLTRRYSTRDQALQGHQEVCRIVMKGIRAAAKELPNQ